MLNRRSIWAVVAGVLAIVVVTTLIDVLLHALGVFPPMPQPLTDTHAVLATSYRIVIGVMGAWLTARLAPRDPMKHAMVLGILGVVVALVGLIATWNLGLGPRWYPIALVLLSIPLSWAGARLHEVQTR